MDYKNQMLFKQCTDIMTEYRPYSCKGYDFSKLTEEALRACVDKLLNDIVSNLTKDNKVKRYLQTSCLMVGQVVYEIGNEFESKGSTFDMLNCALEQIYSNRTILYDFFNERSEEEEKLIKKGRLHYGINKEKANFFIEYIKQYVKDDEYIIIKTESPFYANSVTIAHGYDNNKLTFAISDNYVHGKKAVMVDYLKTQIGE